LVAKDSDLRFRKKFFSRSRATPREPRANDDHCIRTDFESRQLIKKGVRAMSRKIFFWPALLLIAGAATAFALVSTPTLVRKLATQLAPNPIPSVTSSPDRVRAGALWPQLRWYFKAFGDRLERPGRERVTLAGMIDRVGEQPWEFTAVAEFPDRLRLTMMSGFPGRTIVYDGQAARVIDGSLTNADKDLIESMVNDTAEHFFSSQIQGAPTRHLGNRFREDDGSTANYEGPFHDIFSLLDRVRMGPETRSQTKLYYFNSINHLLEKVHYQISRNGALVDVETRISHWHRIQDQQVPRRIARLENGQPVISLTITSATLGPRLSDGIF